MSSNKKVGGSSGNERKEDTGSIPPPSDPSRMPPVEESREEDSNAFNTALGGDESTDQSEVADPVEKKEDQKKDDDDKGGSSSKQRDDDEKKSKTSPIAAIGDIMKTFTVSPKAAKLEATGSTTTTDALVQQIKEMLDQMHVSIQKTGTGEMILDIGKQLGSETASDASIRVVSKQNDDGSMTLSVRVTVKEGSDASKLIHQNDINNLQTILMKDLPHDKYPTINVDLQRSYLDSRGGQGRQGQDQKQEQSDEESSEEE